MKLLLEDQRQEGAPLDLKFAGELTPIQEGAAAALLGNDTGVFVAPPGIGKTVLGTYLVARRGRSTLILVHRKPLLAQWVAQLAMFLGIEERDFGRIGGGKRKPNRRLDVAMIQSLVHKDKVEDLVTGYGHVIVDECHHLPGISFERVLSEVKARYVLGLTATPQRRDGHHPITEMQLGRVRFKVSPKNKAARPPFDHKLVVRETSFRMPGDAPEPSIHDIYRALANDDARNQRIIDDVIAAIQEGRSPKHHQRRFASTRPPFTMTDLGVHHGPIKAFTMTEMRAFSPPQSRHKAMNRRRSRSPPGRPPRAPHSASPRRLLPGCYPRLRRALQRPSTS